MKSIGSKGAKDNRGALNKKSPDEYQGFYSVIYIILLNSV